jgi:hypothetical protein
MRNILLLIFLLFFTNANAKKIEQNHCTYYISPQGDDTNNGKNLKTPFKTLEKVKSSIRDNILPAKGVTICLREGIYKRTESFELNSLDSGTETQPIVYKAYKNENVRIVGAKSLNNSWFKLVTKESKYFNKLDEKAKGRVYSINLKKYGITDVGRLKERGFHKSNISALELFSNSKPMTLARWPNKNQNETKKQSEKDDTITLYGETSPRVAGIYKKYKINDGVNSYKREELINGLQYYLYRYTWDYKGETYTAWFVSTDYNRYPTKDNPSFSYYKPKLNKFHSGNLNINDKGAINHGYAIIKDVLSSKKAFTTYYDKRLARWEMADKLWFHGYWNRDWADLHIRGSVNREKITLEHTPQFGLGKGKYFYVENLLEELTEAGEWYLDRDTKILYFWPIDDITKQEILVSMLAEPLVKLKNTSYVEFKNITFEMSRAEIFDIKGNHNKITNSTLRNAGTTAIVLQGNQNKIENCNIYYTGNSGIHIFGSKENIQHLIKANNIIKNNDIHHTSQWATTFYSAIKMERSVGNIIKNNDIHDLPYTAIWVQGNEHLVEYNHIYKTNEFNSDGGAVYSGRSWGDRGNVIRYNFIHDLNTHFEGSGVHGVYLDDVASGFHVHNNIFYNLDKYAIMTGGGRDNIIEKNIFVKTSGFHTDCRGIRAIDNKKGSSWNFLERLAQYNVEYTTGKWKMLYPKLAKIPNNWKSINSEFYPNDFYKNGEKHSRWLYPEGSKFINNRGFNNKTWVHDYCKSIEYKKTFADVSNNTPNDNSLENIEMNLKKGSSLFSLDSNFKKIGRVLP